MTERCSWALLITLQKFYGAFREGRVFSNFEGISGWGVKTSECMVLSSCCRQQANFFSKMLTYKRAYSGVKIIIVRARPGPQL